MRSPAEDILYVSDNGAPQQLVAFDVDGGRLRTRRVFGPGTLGLTLDLGHLHCQGETPIVDQVRSWADVLWNVHIEDMRACVHDHLMFGEG